MGLGLLDVLKHNTVEHSGKCVSICIVLGLRIVRLSEKYRVKLVEVAPRGP